MAAGRSPPTFLLLGAAGGGKSLLVRRLRPERRGARGAGRAPRHAAHGGHQPDGPAAAAEGDRAGAGRLHGPHLAQLLRRVQRSPGEQHRGRGPEGRSRREGLRGGGRSVPSVSPRGGISLPRALLWPSPVRGCSRHTRALLSLLPPSSWWMPPTPARSPRPASSCSRSSLQRRSPLCPSWCSSTRLTCPATCRWWR